MFRKTAVILVGLMPSSKVKIWLLRRCGYDVHPSARFGPSLIVGVANMSIGSGARVGPFNVFRDLVDFTLGDGSVVGQWNWISAAKPLLASPGCGVLKIGRESAITSRHYVDASGGIYIGSFTTIAGVRSTFITHGINWKVSSQTTKPIKIGSYCLISSNVNIAPGTEIADRSVVGMGATVAGSLRFGKSLYLAARAEQVKSGLTGRYFDRTRGFVEPLSEGVSKDSQSIDGVEGVASGKK